MTKRGVVRWFNPIKGYGFIIPEEDGKDVFVHISEVTKAGLRELKENMELEYEEVPNKGKIAAANLGIVV